MTISIRIPAILGIGAVAAGDELTSGEDGRGYDVMDRVIGAAVEAHGFIRRRSVPTES